MTSILDALNSIALEKYAQAFQAAGFSALEDFFSLNPNDLEKLLNDVGMLKGHTFKLKKLIEDSKVGIVTKAKPMTSPGVGSSAGYMGVGPGVNGMSSMSSMSNMNTVNTMNSMNSMNGMNSMNNPGNYNSMGLVGPNNSLGSMNNMNSMGSMNSSNPHGAINSMNNNSGLGSLQSKMASNQMAYNQKEPIKPNEANYEKDFADKSNMVKNQIRSFQSSKESLVGSLRQLMDIDLEEYFTILSQLKSMQDSIRSILQTDIEMAN